MFERFKRLLLGKPRDIEDPQVFHSISLIAFLAWVGLGADGLSSSAYGPDEAFRALGQHHYLAIALVVAIAFTVFIISYAYSRIIEHFPFGGGGYVVASKLLGPRWGVVSGSALLVDYVFTISVSIAAGADACFSFLPLSWHPWKFPIEFAVILALMVMNVRGVKESVTVLMPIFMLFLVTHVVLIGGTLLTSAGNFPAVAADVHAGFAHDMATIGFMGIFALFLHSYSMGAGTYTGIEAVSNGLQIMREPKVQTAQRTMLYMAVSLAVTAGGIALSYLLVHAQPVAGKTMNAVLTDAFSRRLTFLGPNAQHAFAVVTLLSESVLLFVAAQTGFIDAPRVMANMANDSWLPHRFRTLSDRLTMQDGVILTSTAAILTLLYTHGETSTLVLMYSINVFLTFSLSESGMVRYWLRHRRRYPDWARHIVIHLIGLVLCASILVVSVYEKFTEGGWVTLALTAGLIAVCLIIKRHYQWVRRNLSRLDEILASLPVEPAKQAPAPDRKSPTAILLVGGYGGLGIHSLLTIQRLFPNYFKNFVFISVGVIDSASFKGVEEVEEMRQHTEESLKRYVELANHWGLAADYRFGIGIEVLEEAEKLCLGVSKEFPRSIVFTGKLVFEQERWFQRLLHNETAYQLQRRLQFAGLNTMVLPVRVMAPAPAQTAAASAAA